MNMHEPVRVIAEEPPPIEQAPVETLTSQALQLRPEFLRGELARLGAAGRR